jgi:hypothetical protein
VTVAVDGAYGGGGVCGGFVFAFCVFLFLCCDLCVRVFTKLDMGGKRKRYEGIKVISHYKKKK